MPQNGIFINKETKKEKWLMKKNKAMRAAGVLFIATMLTTCLTAGTLAKYTTGDSAGDNARVAKFGVQIVANGSLFGDSYKDAENGNTPVFKASGNGITVDASDNKNVVAPGTKNDNGLGFAVTGTPEVDVTLDLTVKTENVFLGAGTYGVMAAKPANAVTADNFAKLKAEVLYTEEDGVYTVVGEGTDFDKNATYYVLQNEVTVESAYYPVVYKLEGATSAEGSTASDSAKDVALSIAKKFNSELTANSFTNSDGKDTLTTSKIVKANTDISADLSLGSEKITWAWAFEQKNEDNKVIDDVDKMDTILGDLQSGDVNVVKISDNDIKAPIAGTDYNLTTGIEFTINATQID